MVSLMSLPCYTKIFTRKSLPINLVSVAVSVAAAEAGVGEDAVPGLADEEGAPVALQFLFRREAEEDVFEKVVVRSDSAVTLLLLLEGGAPSSSSCACFGVPPSARPSTIGSGPPPAGSLGWCRLLRLRPRRLMVSMKRRNARRCVVHIYGWGSCRVGPWSQRHM